MHVVHVCATRLPVPPDGYGGTERLVYWIAREQQRLGLRVSVIADATSRIAAQVPGITLIPWDGRRDALEQVPDDADVLHLHRLPEPARSPDRPFLITEHGVRKPGATFLPNTVFVSRAHARLHGSTLYVDNGVPLDEYRCDADKRDYLLFMARMEWPRKNARTALDLAVDCGLPLHITGRRSPWLTPRVWGAWMRQPARAARLVHGERYCDGPHKQALLAGARALFHIVNWHEPFALVVHEALASGTPVLAAPNGALADFVVDGDNGALVRDYAQAVEALRRYATLDASAWRRLAARCRETAATAEACARGYMRLYERLVAGETLSPPPSGRADDVAPPVIVRRPPGFRPPA